MSAASIIKRVHSPFPSLTYPCHATLATGCYPDKTGIFHNLTHPNHQWQFYRSAIKVPTILEIAEKAGISCASICWPVLGGASIDYVIGEIWTESPYEDPTRIFSSVNSQKAQPIFERNKHFLNWMKTPEMDQFATLCTADIIKEAHPGLLMAHLSYLDHQKHQLGIEKSRLGHAYAFLDDCIGCLIAATKQAGIYEKTKFILLGDHGLQNIHKIFNLNAVFKQMGYFRSESDWDLYSECAGCSSQVYMRNISNDKAESVLLKILKTYQKAVRRCLDTTMMSELHLNGPFSFCLESNPHYSFGKCLDEIFTNPTTESFSMANHGYFSSYGPEATCAVQSNKSIEIIEQAEMVDIAPSILQFLSIDIPSHIDGRVVPMKAFNTANY
jgi:predicted AlkP superfamily pyrophosphatase or phosphodiesterase